MEGNVRLGQPITTHLIVTAVMEIISEYQNNNTHMIKQIVQITNTKVWNEIPYELKNACIFKAQLNKNNIS